MPEVFIGAGSNADPERQLRLALSELERRFGALRCSSVYRGPAVGVLWVSAAACAGIAALSVAAGGWVLGVGAAGRIPRLLAGAAALLLLFLDPVTIAAGLACLLAAVALTTIDRRRQK